MSYQISQGLLKDREERVKLLENLLHYRLLSELVDLKEHRSHIGIDVEGELKRRFSLLGISKDWGESFVRTDAKIKSRFHEHYSSNDGTKTWSDRSPLHMYSLPTNNDSSLTEMEARSRVPKMGELTLSELIVGAYHVQNLANKHNGVENFSSTNTKKLAENILDPKAGYISRALKMMQGLSLHQKLVVFDNEILAYKHPKLGKSNSYVTPWTPLTTYPSDFVDEKTIQEHITPEVYDRIIQE